MTLCNSMKYATGSMSRQTRDVATRFSGVRRESFMTKRRAKRRVTCEYDLDVDIEMSFMYVDLPTAQLSLESVS